MEDWWNYCWFGQKFNMAPFGRKKGLGHKNHSPSPTDLSDSDYICLFHTIDYTRLFCV